MAYECNYRNLKNYNVTKRTSKKEFYLFGAFIKYLVLQTYNGHAVISHMFHL